ncbi:phospholipase D-like domain-containing protein [Marispirochaeta aestuarii]|uniref:phospholipase D-like domain-containing protein n=1 Tax=Marispirochaeta aestuarii TaxID=1963862 RepID=UPI0029C89BFA|nr:phospholipase D-like domain-containing protein [Marispirochaeta aestuarii]
MSKFLTTKGISYELENIIKRTKSTLYIVTPYLKLHEQVVERLKYIDKKGKSIVIIFGKSGLTKKEMRNLNEIKNIDLYYYENLHAKCFHNFEQAIIGSMNLYEYSELNNREIGVFLENTSPDESLVIEDLIEEINGIQENSKLLFDRSVDVELRNYEIGNGSPLSDFYKHPVVKKLYEINEDLSFVISDKGMTIGKFYDYASYIDVKIEDGKYALYFYFQQNYYEKEKFRNTFLKMKKDFERFLQTQIIIIEDENRTFAFKLMYQRDYIINKVNKKEVLWTFQDFTIIEDRIINSLLHMKNLAVDVGLSMPKNETIVEVL